MVILPSKVSLTLASHSVILKHNTPRGQSFNKLLKHETTAHFQLTCRGNLQKHTDGDTQRW